MPLEGEICVCARANSANHLGCVFEDGSIIKSSRFTRSVPSIPAYSKWNREILLSFRAKDSESLLSIASTVKDVDA